MALPSLVFCAKLCAVTAELINSLAVLTIVLSGVALVVGVVLIRQGKREAHKMAMLIASALATVFLVLYLTRLGMGYEKKYAGPVEWRTAYYVLLISHIILAAANLPLAVGALWQAWQGLKRTPQLDPITEAAQPFFAAHRRWVRWTVPVWLYVAITGWIIYLVLGQYGEVIKG